MNTIISLCGAFKTIRDPRIERTKKHKLVDILIIALCATICGVDGWEEMEIFAEKHEEWFKSFLELPSGIPSHDTIHRVFSRIDPKEFNKILLRWTEALHQSVEGKVVAIDGKTLRGSFDSATGKAALQMVSAWAHESNLVLGQLAVEKNENELSKIPSLLRMLHLKGAIVTIDAIGCQKEITRIIREEKKADYVLGLKKNQPNLYKHIENLFIVAEQNSNFITDSYTSEEMNRGRTEQRTCVCIDVSEHPYFSAQGWNDIVTIAKIHTVRIENGKIQKQTRYFITSLSCKAQQIARAVRTHWSIENTLHWCLDMTFFEDASRIRKDNAPENMAILRRIAFSLAKARTPKNMTVKRARFLMMLDWSFAIEHFFSR